ncbi:hypothetical protein A2V56_05330 [Candidatus Woesebacteria bacterium RBG_19FT_COMBO_42_9]|uniref:Uncharacterized protein n=1 Tax=Candidatus Woesebacteria bacterium RBG_16_42_24 TaxID=1802485 RepID=A0A1F7XLG1_9BACT|nr:MAG: hypothetical protein A2V97_03815 [Candidatus Woesebacteria bacterium RBG_16_42_24]OGM17301.1 MAG: hypothetical protein A2V56_05330 [Candidatus Woesebacteria bacterium RBG_19FT_COMBO_42_9]OGM68024.1 MAG: hypothetical protein A2985_00980 [Candidatus Woesebacteria bacterium RIFCSPLOWO2_01_FULL_43_11]
MKKKTPALVSTAILTVITIFMWIAFSVYRALITQPSVNVPPEILEPISPDLDRETLASLAARTYFGETDVPETFVNQGPQITQELSQENPTLTPPAGGSPSVTPEATGSGELTPTP